jgi:hypothetical protein
MRAMRIKGIVHFCRWRKVDRLIWFGPSVSASALPCAAEKLLSLACPPDRLEAVLGCMEECYVQMAARHGERFARRWYWWQTARSVAWFGMENLTRVVAARELLKRLVGL